MTVGIVLITHGQLAAQLLDIAENILCQRIAPVTRVEVPANINPQALGEYADRVRDTIAAANAGSGVLVLTDVAACIKLSRAIAAAIVRHCQQRRSIGNTTGRQLAG